jgi:hypothetical protein
MCGKESRKVIKALLLGVVALCQGCETQPLLVPCSGSTASLFSPLSSLPGPKHPLFLDLSKHASFPFYVFCKPAVHFS